MTSDRLITHNKTAEIWTSLDMDDPQITQQIERLTRLGYFVVIYRSGHADLQEMTAQLLLANHGVGSTTCT